MLLYLSWKNTSIIYISLYKWYILTNITRKSVILEIVSVLNDLHLESKGVASWATYSNGICSYLQIWSLSEGRMLRSISFPTSIGSVALDPRSHIFYAGGRDGKIYVTAMGVDLSFHGSDESSILGTLDDHRFA